MTRQLSDDLLANLQEVFREEAQERLREMQAALGQGASDEAVNVLFRHAHSIKGAAAAVGHAGVEQLAHDFEDWLDAARAANGFSEERAQRMLDDLGSALEPVLNGVPGRIAPRPSELPADGGQVLTGSRSAEERVRVAARDLEQIAADVGDLVVASDEWRWLAAGIGALSKRLGGQTRHGESASSPALLAQLTGVSRQLREQVHRNERLVDGVRLQLQAIQTEPVDGLLDSAAREARRLALELGRTLEVAVDGSDVTADRKVISRLRDPLIHLVRNAVDHGVESPERRESAGKQARAVLTITARTVGSSLVVEVADDGAGIDLGRVRARGEQAGLDVDRMDDDAVRALIFEAGFSTRDDVSRVSGRGVGLAAVRDEVESLYGSVGVTSRPGEGTTFRLEVPQGAGGVRCLVVAVGGRRMAVPVSSVVTILSLVDSPLKIVGGSPVIIFDGVTRPVVDGAGLFSAEVTDKAAYAIVLSHAGRTCALPVEEVITQVELVVKGLPAILGDLEGVSGAAVLGDGEVVPVLLASAVFQHVGGTGWSPMDAEEHDTQVQGPRLLVVDDSTTTRTLIRTILMSAGFSVDTAEDGTVALQRLRDGDHDLVVSDIEMPGLDGFGLTRAIRADATLGQLPIVLVSSRAGSQDRAESAAAGADAHLDKGAFDQGQLVAVIRELLA